LAALNIAAPAWTLHEELSSSSPPFVSKISLAHVPLATQSLYGTTEGRGQMERGRGQVKQQVVADP
jgi:hypothetical protein